MPIRPTIQIAPGDAEALLGGGLVEVNVQQMRRMPNRPRIRDLIASGQLYYSRLDPDEQWQTFDQVLRRLAAEGAVDADCEDLASLVAAEYRVTGEDPGARVHVYRTGPSVSHVVVRRSNGRLEDPSIAAGMGSPAQQQRDALAAGWP